MARKYGDVKSLLPAVKEMLSQGQSHREIAEHFGLKDKYVIKELLKRERRKERKIEAGIPPKQRGRKAVVTLAEYKYENKRLKMENELLRDFLQLAGRR